jgi:hypothetical protein
MYRVSLRRLSNENELYDIVTEALREEDVPRKRSVGGPRRAAFLSREGVILTDGMLTGEACGELTGVELTNEELADELLDGETKSSSETRTGGGRVKDGEKER